VTESVFVVKSDKELTPVAFVTVASAHASPALKASSNHLLLLTMTLDACTTDSASVNHTVSCFFMASRVRRNAVAPLGVPIPKGWMPIATTVARLSGYLLFSI
jgi:hypothetical protein